MSLLLARIDDRRIHGQVVLGCCEVLGAGHLVLCDEEVASDAMLRRIYTLAVPAEIEVEFFGIDACVDWLAENATLLPSTVLVTGDCATMGALCDRGAAVEQVTLGGMHARDARVERWPGFFVTDEEWAQLRRMAELGVRIRAQTVPGAPSLDVTAELVVEGSR